MKKQIKILSILVSFAFMFISLLSISAMVFSWYSGQSYIGKTMS